MTRRRPAEHNPFMAANVVNRAGFTIGAEGSNIINVAIQLKDADGNAIAQRAGLLAYLSTDSHGDNIAASAPSSGIAIGTNGLLIETIADKAFYVVSEADGTVDVNITEVGVTTFYIVLIMPDGSLVVSGAITFA
jgi:hypothetical protein